MHILFVSDNFYPESNALANRLYDHARTWVKLGHEVTVLTCVPNFPKGQVFEGYENRWRQVEMLSGIRVVRIKSYIAENKGSLKRIIDYMSFALHAMLQGLFVKKPDVIIGTSPQPFSIFSTWFLSRVKNKPFIFELRDLWPESVIAVGAMSASSKLVRFFDWAIKKMYRSADLIVSVTDSFKRILVEKEHVDADKILVIKNGVDASAIKVTENAALLKEKYGLENKFLVGYVGTIGMAHSVETLLAAAKVTDDPQVHFVIMGAGAQSAYIKEQSLKLENVTFIDSSTRQDAINVLNILNASIVHLKDTPLFSTVIPSKIFESMALNKPILMGVKGESRDIVIDEAKAGLAFEPENAVDLNEAIKKIKEFPSLGDRGLEYVKRHFDRTVLAKRMLSEIQSRLGKRVEVNVTD